MAHRVNPFSWSYGISLLIFLIFSISLLPGYIWWSNLVKHSIGLKSTNLCYYLCNGLSIVNTWNQLHKSFIWIFIYAIWCLESSPWLLTHNCLAFRLTAEASTIRFSVRFLLTLRLLHFSPEENCKGNEIRWRCRPALCPSNTNLTLSLIVIGVLVGMMWLASCLIGLWGNVFHTDWQPVVQEQIPQKPLTTERNFCVGLPHEFCA
jgi:hypothetical protein